MSYTLLSETWPIARKKHRCIWCGQFIPVGEKHRHEKSVFEGQMQDQRWHSECNAAFDAELAHEGSPLEFEPGGHERPPSGSRAAR